MKWQGGDRLVLELNVHDVDVHMGVLHCVDPDSGDFVYVPEAFFRYARRIPRTKCDYFDINEPLQLRLTGEPVTYEDTTDKGKIVIKRYDKDSDTWFFDVVEEEELENRHVPDPEAHLAVVDINGTKTVCPDGPDIQKPLSRISVRWNKHQGWYLEEV